MKKLLNEWRRYLAEQNPGPPEEQMSYPRARGQETTPAWPFVHGGQEAGGYDAGHHSDPVQRNIAWVKQLTPTKYRKLLQDINEWIGDCEDTDLLAPPVRTSTQQIKAAQKKCRRSQAGKRRQIRKWQNMIRASIHKYDSSTNTSKITPQEAGALEEEGLNNDELGSPLVASGYEGEFGDVDPGHPLPAATVRAATSRTGEPRPYEKVRP